MGRTGEKPLWNLWIEIQTVKIRLKIHGETHTRNSAYMGTEITLSVGRRRHSFRLCPMSGASKERLKETPTSSRRPPTRDLTEMGGAVLREVLQRQDTTWQLQGFSGRGEGDMALTVETTL